MTILGAFMIASVVLTSCGGGVEADAAKTCEMMCEGEEIRKRIEGDKEEVVKDAFLTEVEEWAEKAEKFGEEMKEKYKDDEDAKNEIAAILAKCDCK